MKYFYKQGKRVLKLSNDADAKPIMDKGYVQVLDKTNPEGSVVKKATPKPKKKIKKKAKKK
tara:strand:+ start:492 stop:674 length:183 start_codon:yes stop_codon:yes gene_type:complete